MKHKSLLLLATILIVVGLVGVSVLGFDSDTFNRGVPFEKSWEFNTKEFQEIKIKSSYGVTIQFVESETEQSSIHITGKLQDEIIQKLTQTNIMNNRLDLDLTPNNEFRVNILDFTELNKQSITIALAKEATLHTLDAELGSNKLIVNDAVAKNIDLRTSSGDLVVHRLQGQDIHLTSSSGRLEGYELEGEIQAQTSSGGITLKNVTGKLNMKSSSGSIKAFDIVGDVNASASSGSVMITQKEGLLTVKTTSGSVKLTQQTVVQETNVQTSSGSVRMQVPKQFAGFYDVQTNSGLIRIPDSKRETKDYIKVRTSSGSIKINEE